MQRFIAPSLAPRHAHFRRQLAPEVLMRLLEAGHQAPSVGLMQPWRFIRISDPALRASIQQQVEQERVRTAEALGERADEFMKLKVEGISDCAEVLVAALTDDREKHIFGRRTLPEMDLASLSCAIQNMWLAARAEGLGMGWVSLFEPQALAELLRSAGAKARRVSAGAGVSAFTRCPWVLEGWGNERPSRSLFDIIGDPPCVRCEFAAVSDALLGEPNRGHPLWPSAPLLSHRARLMLRAGLAQSGVSAFGDSVLP